MTLSCCKTDEFVGVGLTRSQQLGVGGLKRVEGSAAALIPPNRLASSFVVVVALIRGISVPGGLVAALPR
jgi:hypothetical protein